MPVMTDARIDPDKLLFEGIEPDSGPIFSVSEMAKFFFARTNHWVRWLESIGKMSILKEGAPAKCKSCQNGRTIVVGVDAKGKDKRARCEKCTNPTGDRRDPSNSRIYSLSDIEMIAHGLAQSGVISGTQLRHTLRLLSSQGEMHEII